ncbi:hypothetical protein [Pseudoalteromonas shioyasakiensis]|uniref:hypothetical protein n=1 Tax=Pseudoalteromonas shioyasakiensis TaxID=1190813 RepID=UPI001C3CA773|nr:hypothetical protein [Pseudoalteromonas shioyasakiensis]
MKFLKSFLVKFSRSKTNDVKSCQCKCQSSEVDIEEVDYLLSQVNASLVMMTANDNFRDIHWSIMADSLHGTLNNVQKAQKELKLK